MTFEKKKNIYSTNNILNQSNAVDKELMDRLPQQVYSQSETRGKNDLSADNSIMHHRKTEQISSSSPKTTSQIPRTTNMTQTRNLVTSNLSYEKDSTIAEDAPFFNNRLAHQ